MTHEHYDTVVIGAGVAGAAFAAGVASPDRRVLIVERSAWPRQKVCGCCLNAAAVGSLDRLGLLHRLRPLAASLDRAELHAGGRSAAFARPGGLALCRSVLDRELVTLALDQGAEFSASTTAWIAARYGTKGWTVNLRTLTGERRVTSSLVVAADGLGGASLKALPDFAPRTAAHPWFGVGAIIPEALAPRVPAGVVRMHIAPHGYAGLVRLPDASINLAAALDPAWTKHVGGPAPAIAAIMVEAGGAAIKPHELPLRGTGHLTRRRDRTADAGLLVLGDAAGFVEPFTGEGMAWALAGAETAAGMVNAGLSAETLAEAWQRWCIHHLRARQRSCAAVRLALRSPRLVSSLLALMSAVPSARRSVAAFSRWTERPYATPSAAAARGHA